MLLLKTVANTSNPLICSKTFKLVLDTEQFLLDILLLYYLFWYDLVRHMGQMIRLAIRKRSLPITMLSLIWPSVVRSLWRNMMMKMMRLETNSLLMMMIILLLMTLMMISDGDDDWQPHFQPRYTHGLGAIQFRSGMSPVVSKMYIYTGNSLDDTRYVCLHRFIRFIWFQSHLIQSILITADLIVSLISFFVYD